MTKIAVVDTETTWGDEVMSLGIVIADAKDYKPLDRRYYVFDPEYRAGGIFSNVLFRMPKTETHITTREAALKETDAWLAAAGVEKIFAYNGSFDKAHLPEWNGYEWYDIMRIAAYKQYNHSIPVSAECCKTGKLKRNYGVEPITRMLSGNSAYCEMHNALQDALDELNIMRMLKQEISVYETAGI
ncbi:MAG: hypothetical protein IKO10_04075 [Lachnospiraceae bacterium]|nr:hypothetical protein [Lachnospiraceae bacterium]